MLFIDYMGDKVEDAFSWAAQYAPQWLIKCVAGLFILDICLGAFSV